MKLDQDKTRRVVEWIRSHQGEDEHQCPIRFKNAFWRRKYFQAARQKIRRKDRESSDELESLLKMSRSDIIKEARKLAEQRGDHLLT